VDVEIRPITEDEFEPALRSLEAAFSGGLTDDDLRQERLVAETDRWHAAFEGGRIVGGAAAASYRMTVPGGGQVATAGITAVGVQPTHRRRGINTALMRVQLDDVRERGEPLAALFASEGGIYGRYGYGMAAFLGEVNLEVERSAFVRGHRSSGRMRLVDRAEALPLMRGVYDSEQARRPGMIAVDDRWWEWLFYESSKDKDEPVKYVVHEQDGTVDAYATYKVKHEWPESIAKLEVTVRQLIGSTPQGWADMWRYLFDIDLVHSLNAWNRPVDEPLLDLMQEPRRLRFGLKDGLYVRLVDVPAALSARGYNGEETVVIEVIDPFCPWNEGRYAITTAPNGASCERTTVGAQIACTATDLGAVYLGGTGFRRLHRAGRVQELMPGALALADALFTTDPAPWCSFLF
jgi:predicted acetyltransferase